MKDGASQYRFLFAHEAENACSTWGILWLTNGSEALKRNYPMIKKIVSSLLDSANHDPNTVCLGCNLRKFIFLNGICADCHQNLLCPTCYRNTTLNHEIICKECFSNNICPACFSKASWIRPSHICSNCDNKCIIDSTRACAKCMYNLSLSDNSVRRVYECNVCVKNNRQYGENRYCFICNYDESGIQIRPLMPLCLCKLCWLYDDSAQPILNLPPAIEARWNYLDKMRRKSTER
jgi:hypothetical protein